MTPAEELVVKIRLALDEARTDAVNAIVAGARTWDGYQYDRGRIEAFKAALDIVNGAWNDLGRDEP